MFVSAPLMCLVLKEAIKYPVPRVTDSCELPYGYRSSEPSLQFLNYFFN